MKACPACNSRYEDGVTYCSKDGTPVIVDKIAGAAVTPEGLVGTVISDRYRLVRKLGEGGMGEVYVAEHMHIEKRVALKLLRAEVLSNQEAVTRFKQEARSASSIGHENIIEIDDFGILPDGRVYLTMEYLEGAPLSDMVEEAPIELPRLLDILVQTTHGLAAAHAKGIIHRDMKPENVYVTRQSGRDVPKILDFGIAKVSGNDGNQHLTRTGTIFGTPFYMAPEQALGQPLDHRADIYAMGVIIYECVTGAVPFKGESFMGILTQHITTPPMPPSQQAAAHGRPPIPPHLEAVILHAMAKKPEERYQSMNELAAALTDVYRSIAGAGLTTAFAPPPMSPSQFVPLQVPSGYVQAAMPSGPMSAPHAHAHTPPPHAHPSQQHAPAYSHSQPVMLPPGTPSQGMTPVPGVPQGVVGTTPPWAAPAAAPAKGKGALVAVLVIVGLGLGAGGVSWYFLAGPGKKKEAGAAVTPPVVVTTPDAGAAGLAPEPPVVTRLTPDAGVAGGVVEPPPVVAKDAVVLVDSVPRGAGVWRGDEKLGETPLNVTVIAGDPVELVLRKKGHLDTELVIDGTADKVSKELEHKKTGGKPPPGDGHKPPPGDGHKPPPPPPDDDDSDELE